MRQNKNTGHSPMRTVFAIQRQTEAGAWETTQLFYTAGFAQNAIGKRIDAATLRVEPVQREIYD